MKFCFKKLRYIDDKAFDKGIILDITFEDIIDVVNDFESVIGLDGSNKPVFAKPRFKLVMPANHCDMPMLTNDNYLIGFTDARSSAAVKYRFFFEHCGIEYLNDDKWKEIQRYKHFYKDIRVLTK